MKQGNNNVFVFECTSILLTKIIHDIDYLSFRLTYVGTDITWGKC